MGLVFMKKGSVLLKNIIIIGCGVLTFLTVLLYAYTSFYARPTGDDLGFSYRAHGCWEETHSVIKVLDATMEEIGYQRDNWASDYTMVFFVSLMPEVFKPWTFWIACWFILFSLVISIILFSREILFNRFNLPKWLTYFFGCAGLLVILQEMPSTNSGMYWYTGAVHYPLAFSFELLFLTCALWYLRKGRKCTIVLMSLLAVAIGGDGFFASVFLIVLYFFILVYGVVKKEKRIFHLGIPMVVLMTCFIYALTAEGPYKSRASEQITISISLVAETIIKSVIRSVEYPIKWIGNSFLIIPVLLMFIFILLSEIDWEKIRFEFPKPVLMILVLFLSYASVFAPWVYSEMFDELGASMGPENYCFYTFVLMLFISLIYVWGYFKKRCLKVRSNRLRSVVGMGIILLCMLFAYQNRHNIKMTHGYVGMEYILSGSAKDYKAQCEENMKMLLDPTIQDVELIQTNAFQGLLCNMVATENPNDFTSMVYSRFYGKESVIMK